MPKETEESTGGRKDHFDLTIQEIQARVDWSEEKKARAIAVLKEELAPVLREEQARVDAQSKDDIQEATRIISAMKSKPAKRSKRSPKIDQSKAENRPPEFLRWNEDSNPDGLLKFLQWNKELDPASVAIVALHLDAEACKGESREAQHDPRHASREVLVRAALLLREAHDIVTNGPSLEDLPSELQFQFLDETGITPLAEAWTATFSDPNERFLARTKIITGQERPERAEADLRMYLEHQCREAGRMDPKAVWSEFVRALEAEDAPFTIAINGRRLFSEWKRKHKSEAARQSREKGLEQETAKKV